MCDLPDRTLNVLSFQEALERRLVAQECIHDKPCAEAEAGDESVQFAFAHELGVGVAEAEKQLLVIYVHISHNDGRDVVMAAGIVAAGVPAQRSLVRLRELLPIFQKSDHVFLSSFQKRDYNLIRAEAGKPRDSKEIRRKALKYLGFRRDETHRKRTLRNNGEQCLQKLESIYILVIFRKLFYLPGAENSSVPMVQMRKR